MRSNKAPGKKIKVWKLDPDRIVSKKKTDGFVKKLKGFKDKKLKKFFKSGEYGTYTAKDLLGRYEALLLSKEE